MFAINYFALLVCGVSISFAFDEGADYFEQKKYPEAVHAFLTHGAPTDVRIPFYIKHLQEEKAFDFTTLGPAQQHRLGELERHFPYVPIVLGAGKRYLAVSLNIQKLEGLSNNKKMNQKKKATQIETHIENIIKIAERGNELGYAYDALARWLERTSPKDPRICDYYTKGAAYSCLHAVQAVARIHAQAPKKKKNPVSLFKVGNAIACVVERATDTQAYEEENTIINRYPDNPQQAAYLIAQGLKPEDPRKRKWQLEAARMGNSVYQSCLLRWARPFQAVEEEKDEYEGDHWAYFAALSGDPQAQSVMAFATRGCREELSPPR